MDNFVRSLIELLCRFAEVLIYLNECLSDDGVCFAYQTVEESDLAGQDKELDLFIDAFKSRNGDMSISHAGFHEIERLLVVPPTDKCMTLDR